MKKFTPFSITYDEDDPRSLVDRVTKEHVRKLMTKAAKSAETDHSMDQTCSEVTALLESLHWKCSFCGGKDSLADHWLVARDMVVVVCETCGHVSIHQPHLLLRHLRTMAEVANASV